MARKRAVVQQEDLAGLYVRVSLDRAAHGLQEEILSPETQLDRCRQYCGAQQWPVALVEQDIDESGYRQHYSHRRGLVRLLDAVEHRKITKVVVFKFSRLSRRLKEFLEICDRVENAGAGIVSITEQIDTSTPAGRLIRNILASFAQFQSEEISEQIFESWMTKAKKGERPPGCAPFGTVNTKGILEPDPKTHWHLLTMYRVYRDTSSIRAVWDYLIDHGIPAPKADQWNLNTIRGILTNPVYIGRLEWAGETFQTKWEPLVPEALWNDVQELIRSRQTLPTKRRDARLLTGLIRCSQCGRPMWTKYAKRSLNGHSHLRRIYWCCSPHNQRRGCDIPAVDGEEVEQSVWEAALLVIRKSDVHQVVALASRHRTECLSRTGGLRRQQLVDEEEKLRRQANALFDLLNDGSITREQFREQNLRLVDRLSAIRQELAGLALSPVEPNLAAVRQAAERAALSTTDDERRKILAALGAEIIVGDRVYLDLLGLHINLRARRIGDTRHFGERYHGLDFRGSMLTDKQERFIQRTYHWADKEEIARRLGRTYKTLLIVAKRLRREGLLRPMIKDASR